MKLSSLQHLSFFTHIKVKSTHAYVYTVTVTTVGHGQSSVISHLNQDEFPSLVRRQIQRRSSIGSVS